MPAGREWATPSSHSKKKKVKFTKPASSAEPSRGNAPSSTSAKSTPPVPATNPFVVLGEKNSTSSGNPPEIQETAAEEPTPHVEDNSPPDHASAISTGPPNPPNLEDGEVESGDADIPDSVARALLDALQEKRQGNQLPAAMAPLARVRASQLQQCVANGTEPQEAVIQATLDIIAMGQGPPDPVALADKVSLVSQTPDVQCRREPWQRPIIYLGEAHAPGTSDQSFAVLGEKNSTSSGNPPEIQETAAEEPTPHVEDNSPPDHASAISTGPPNPPNLEDGEVESGDADIPDSVARALFDALQEKRQGNQLPAAMAPLARVRASQLQQCVANGTEPQEAVIQATLDIIAMGQGPPDPVALRMKDHVRGKLF